MTNIEQLNPLQDTQCSICKNRIVAGYAYFRITIDPDGLDEHGADICSKCNKKWATNKTP